MRVSRRLSKAYHPVLISRLREWGALRLAKKRIAGLPETLGKVRVRISACCDWRGLGWMLCEAGATTAKHALWIGLQPHPSLEQCSQAPQHCVDTPDYEKHGRQASSSKQAGEDSAKSCDICFIVGTSAVVYPAAYIPITAKQHGAYLVELNIEKTEISNSVDLSLIGKSGEILPEILKLVEKVKS